MLQDKFNRVRMGQITFTVISDGVDKISRQRLLRRFPDISERDLRRAFDDIGRDFDEAVSGYNLLIAQIGTETILVDTGDGGELIPNMMAACIRPDDITLVILTHAHGDHIFGILDDTGQPNFPNAKYVMSEVEFAVWQEQVASGLSDRQSIFYHVQQQIRAIALDETIIEGVKAFPLVGHTVGQIGLRFESEGQVLLHLADLVHSPVQIAHPDWCAKFDANKPRSVMIRQEMLHTASETRHCVFFYHLDFPAIGTIEQAVDAFTFVPTGD